MVWKLWQLNGSDLVGDSERRQWRLMRLLAVVLALNFAVPVVQWFLTFFLCSWLLFSCRLLRLSVVLCLFYDFLYGLQCVLQ